MWNDIEQERESKFKKEIYDNPPESSMRYVSDMQLMDNDIIYEEQLSDVESEWTPKEGLFTMKSASYIANYLIQNSDSIGQAIQRLTFYMNRSGKNLKNKTILNKAKKILQDKNEKEKD